MGFYKGGPCEQCKSSYWCLKAADNLAVCPWTTDEEEPARSDEERSKNV